MTTYLVAPGLTDAQAFALATQHGCGGYYLAVPPVWQEQSVSEGWAYPCIVTMEDGLVTSWTPV